MIADQANMPFFRAASIWEVAIKGGLGHADFQVDAGQFPQGQLAGGYEVLGVSGRHAAQAAHLTALHADPLTGCSSRRPGPMA